MLNLNNHFGIDVQVRFDAWFHGEFAAEFQERWPGKGISLVVLDPDSRVAACLDWDTPLNHAVIVDFLGNEESHEKKGGTLNNVAGKLQYVLRTSCDSLRAETDYAYLRPGDFPWEGAGERKDFIGGVSGLAKEEDWEVFGRCIDRLIELLGKVGRAAKAKAESLHTSDDPPIGAKYLHVTLTDDEVWPSLGLITRPY
jgi:hypothetical protein